MSQSDIDKAYFVAFCVEQYKHHTENRETDIPQMFFDKGVTAYLSEHYEVLHTQSVQWLMEEIDQFISQQEA